MKKVSIRKKSRPGFKIRRTPAVDDPAGSVSIRNKSRLRFKAPGDNSGHGGFKGFQSAINRVLDSKVNDKVRIAQLEKFQSAITPS